MNIKRLADELSVSSHVELDDISKVKMMGFRTIICNLPDSEDSSQPEFSEIEKEAKALDLSIFYLPVNSGDITSQNVEDFEKLISQSQGPTLAYCRSGGRCEALWSLSRQA